LYFFSAAIPAAVRRRGCRYPVIAEVETYGPVLVDPLVTPEDSSGNAQRAAVLRLTQLWVMPDVPPVVRAELERYWTPVDVWRPEGDRQAIDAFVARKPGVGR
jgi:hypothetical protein